MGTPLVLVAARQDRAGVVPRCYQDGQDFARPATPRPPGAPVAPRPVARPATSTRRKRCCGQTKSRQLQLGFPRPCAQNGARVAAPRRRLPVPGARRGAAANRAAGQDRTPHPSRYTGLGHRAGGAREYRPIREGVLSCHAPRPPPARRLAPASARGGAADSARVRARCCRFSRPAVQKPHIPECPIGRTSRFFGTEVPRILSPESTGTGTVLSDYRPS
jgi:hypothetical protein